MEGFSVSWGSVTGVRIVSRWILVGQVRGGRTAVRWMRNESPPI